jgi:molecular chaperone GrpE (heat shock protein)
MTKLSANRAAKEAGIAKKTLLEAISSGRLTAEKNDKGHWEIDPAELFRAYPKTSLSEPKKPQPTPQENRRKTSEASVLEVEVKMLREQIERMDAERDRERSQLSEQIEALKDQAERQSADHRQALAALTDQRERAAESTKRGLWARLVDP